VVTEMAAILKLCSRIDPLRCGVVINSGLNHKLNTTPAIKVVNYGLYCFDYFINIAPRYRYRLYGNAALFSRL